MTTIDLNLPPVPGELKIVAPYVSRAQELKGKDPVIAYYCLYHAVQAGIQVKTHQKDSRAYLMSLMTKLETMKDQLKDRKEISSDEAAAPYIENFALKVFSNADNEDRKGGSNRSTAKKFLAASNFLELLVLFDDKYLNKDIQAHEKIKYAKWKAADIAKAFREGRVPTAGPPTNAIETSEDEFGDKHSDFEDVSMGSSAAKQAKSSSSTEIHEHPSSEPATAKPALPTMDSSSSMDTVTHNKTTQQSSVPKHISTAAAASLPPPQYVIDVSTPSPVSSSNAKTPLKSPIPGDGMWSTAATPGLDSPNFGGSWGRAALNSLSPAALALFNTSIAKGDSPISPGMSPKPRSGLGANVVTASDLDRAKAPKITRGSDAEDGVETDEEDGQWSTAGNDPFSRQNSMMPLPGGRSFNLAHNAPGLVVTPSLGAVREEASPAKSSAPNTAHPAQNVTTSAALSIPLPPSASNSAPSSPGNRPSSVAWAASHPLPPLLPPPSKTPTSIKSESHVLPTTEPEEKVYKYTSNIVGDSTSDSEASYNVRKRANTVVPGQPGKAENDENTSSHHVRSSSVNTAAAPQPPTPTALQPPMSAPATKTSMDDDWERTSISRLARLPDSVSGSDMDSLSGRLRGLDLPNTSSSDTTPIAPNHAHTGQDDFKSRRNTIRAGGPSDPRSSGSDFGISLPGVPSAPPVGDWGRRGSGKSDSDSGGEGDVLARLPSAPAAPPTLQDQLPHVAVFHKPASPRDELQTNPHFPSYPPPIVSGAPNGDHDDSLTPRSQTHSRAPSSTSSGAPVVPSTIPPPPPPAGYPQPPSLSTTASSDIGSSVHLGYTPPNSVVSPHANFAGNLVPGVPYHHYAQHPYPPPHGVQSPSHHPSVPPVTVPQGFYPVGAQPNGVSGSHDEFGLGIPPRPLPTSLEPEIIAKAQKHAKFAQSALNFDDLETARAELKKALRLLS